MSRLPLPGKSAIVADLPVPGSHPAQGQRSALKIASEKPALEGDSGAENVTKKAGFGHISPADLPRNEGQVRPLIEQLEHNGERLKVWADVVATGEKPTQRLVEANPQVRANLPAPAVVEAKRQSLPICQFPVMPGRPLAASGRCG